MRTLSTNNASQIDNTVVDELFLVELGFSTPVRLSSRQNITFNSQTYTGVNDFSMNINTDGTAGRITFFDENFTVTPTLMAQGTGGITVTVKAVYGNSTTFASSSADDIFVGELGRCTLDNATLTLLLVEPSSVFLPAIIIDDETGFSHLTPAGTKISTPNGIIILDRK